jgi:hypothetical protein
MIERPVQRIKLHTDTRDPLPTDDSSLGFGYFTFWINTATDEAFMCTNAAIGAAVWTESGGAGVYVSAIDPTVNDDANAGFNAGGGWLNTTTENVFQCLDNSIGAAVWRNRTPLFDYDYLVGPVGKAPFQTIQSAVDQAATDAGWTRDIQARVGILNGDYAESVSIPSPWINLEAVDVFTGVVDVYPTGQRVSILGTLTYTVNLSGIANDITLRGIAVLPTTGPAIHVAGGDYSKRIYLFDCNVKGSPDSDTITYAPLASGGVTIAPERCTLTSEVGYIVMDITTGGRFAGIDCTAYAGSFQGTVFRLSGNAFFMYAGRGTPGLGKGVINGEIEVLVGTVNNLLVLSGVGFWRRGTADIIVDGTLSSFSFWKDCYSAIYPGPVPVELVIAGTNAVTFKEAPTANVGDIRRHDGQRWNSVPAPALNGDYDIPALTTTGVYQLAATAAITRTPEHDVIVRVNGVEYKPARDTAEKLTSFCFFSDDGGGTVTTIGSIAGGASKLYWGGGAAGFQLDPTDVIDLIYEV